MTSRLAFNLGAALIAAGLTSLLTVDHLSLPWMACVGLLGLLLVLGGVLLIQTAEELEEMK